MNALWPLGEATVRQVRESLAARSPRAYTTIMTILDRLAQKGIVARRKVGRAYVYRANLRPADAQEHAVEQVVAGFFGGSRRPLGPFGGEVFAGWRTLRGRRACTRGKARTDEEIADEAIDPVVPQVLDRTFL